MKRTIYWHLLAGTLIFHIISAGCQKKDTIEPANLEKTTWKLTKEIWTFPNGNTQTFIKQSDLDGIFSWVFINNTDVKVLHSPYYFEENGTWAKTNDRITIAVPTNGGTSFIRNYKIIELKGSFMKVDFEEQNGESSENGKASKMYYELRKQ